MKKTLVTSEQKYKTNKHRSREKTKILRIRRLQSMIKVTSFMKEQPNCEMRKPDTKRLKSRYVSWRST